MLAHALALVAMIVGPATITGKAKQARLASVESRVDEKKLSIRDPKETLRSELQEALDGVDWKREGVDRPFEVLAVLSGAESTSTREGVRASFSVQVIVREPSGAILGSVTGRARGEDKKTSRGALEREVLEAAAESASAAIPEAVRKSRTAR
jgi:hypothetical protein